MSASDTGTTVRHADGPVDALLFDADDTLWENNVYFLEITERFIEELEQHGVTRDRARLELTDTERRNVPVHGYGSRAFALSVAEAFYSLVPECPAESVDTLVELARRIHERDELEILPGVREALMALGSRHRLILVTKGDPGEQRHKIARSGLENHFHSVEVVAEKDEQVYREIVERLGLDASRSWMIGNSPRSDINPALAAGLNAVLIPHPHTWELEIEDVGQYGDRLVIADQFGDIVALFAPEDSAEFDA